MPVAVDDKDYDDPVTTEDQLASTILGIPPELLGSSAPAAMSSELPPNGPKGAMPYTTAESASGMPVPSPTTSANGIFGLRTPARPSGPPALIPRMSGSTATPDMPTDGVSDPMLGNGAAPSSIARPSGPAPIPQAPVHDMATHVALADQIAKLSQKTDPKDPKAQASLRQKIASVLVAMGMGWGGRVGEGVAAAKKMQGQNYEDMEDDRKGKLEAAKNTMDQHEYDEGLKEKQFGDQMTGYRAQRQATEDQQRDEDRATSIKDRETAANNTPVGKPYPEVDPATGAPTGNWKQKTKGGQEIDAPAPQKKIYNTPYERSQSDNPNDAKQGRKDYDTEQKRKQAHEDEYESRTPGGKSAGDKPDKVAVRMYNQKAEKLKGSVDEAINNAEVTGKDWSTNPMMRREVKSAIDAYNNHIDAAEDTPGVKAGSKIKYPWDNGSASKTTPSAPPDENRRATAAKNAAPAQSPKTQHKVNDVVDYDGKKYRITSIKNGKAELELVKPK